MSYYAIDGIDDAIDATRAFLWPPDRSRWLKLALVILFVGGSMNPGGVSSGGGDASAPTPTPDVAVPELGVIVAIVGLVVVIGLAFAIVAAIMEFIFVESIRTEAVALRRYWRDRWRQGIRLFGFRIGLMLVAGIGVVLVGGVIAVPHFLLDSSGATIAVLLIGLPVLLLGALAYVIVNAFTTHFVVPIMINEDRAVLAAWGRFWPVLRAQWKQFGVYALIRMVLEIAAGILLGILVLIGAIALLIPLGAVAIVGFVLESLVGWVLVGVAALFFVVGVIALALLLAVPIRTYLRYYELLVLGDADDRFDVIAAQRAAIRGE